MPKFPYLGGGRDQQPQEEYDIDYSEEYDDPLPPSQPSEAYEESKRDD